MVETDARCSTANPLFTMLDQPGIGRHLMPDSPLHYSALDRQAPRRAPAVGENTDEVLSELLGLSSGDIGKLRDARVVGGPIELA